MRRSREKRTQAAFTLIEMLLVIVIIGILAGMLVTRLVGRSEEARITRARADMKGALSLALDLFEQDTGRYPAEDEGLEALTADPGIPGWKGPYLKDGLQPDPWGTPYAYSLSTEHANDYTLTSAGPDQQLGTDDDIKP